MPDPKPGAAKDETKASSVVDRRELLETFASVLDLAPADRAVALDRLTDRALRRAVERLLKESEGECVLDTPGVFALPEAGDLLDLLDGSPIERRWGAYRLVREIDRGGMGAVYLAERADGAYQQRVAVKLLPLGAGRWERRRFERERELLARLDHPGIARLLDGGIGDEGQPYLVMELVEGLPIVDHCTQRRLPVRDILGLFVDVCKAVEAAHRRLIVHCDIKPANILVREDGGVKLLDFGIARLLPHGDGASAGTTVQAGTPDYLSPEMFQGQGVGVSSDVYQLGMLLYVLLAGTVPHRLSELSPFDKERALAEDVTRPPSAACTSADSGLAARGPARARELVGDLDTVALKALRAAPERRYGSVQELREDVERFLLGDPVRARGDAVVYRLRKLIARHRVPAALTAAAATAIFALVVGYTMLLRAERTAAEDAAARAESARAESEQARGEAEAAVRFLLTLFGGDAPGQVLTEQTTAPELFDRAADKVRTSLSDRPLLRARVMRSLADTSLQLGLSAQARSLYEEALEIREAAAGERSREVAESLVDLGRFESLQRNAAAAERHYRPAIAILEAAGSDTGGLLQRALTGLASERVSLGDFAEARQLVERSLESCNAENAAGSDACRPENQLTQAHILRMTGPLSEARRIYRSVLESREAAYGPRAVALLSPLIGLGETERKLDTLGSAQAILERALSIQRESAPSPMLVSRLLVRLARVHRDRRDPGAAVPLLEEALELRAEEVGADSPALDNLLRTLGEAFMEAGRLADAEVRLREARWITDSERERANVDDAMGELRYRQERFEESLGLHRAAYRVRRERLGPAHANSGWSLMGMGRSELALGRLDDAAASLASAVEILGSVYGHASAAAARARFQLARLQHRRGDTDGARGELEAILAIRRDKLAPDHPEIAETLRELEQLARP